jgi:hypothetical protein
VVAPFGDRVRAHQRPGDDHRQRHAERLRLARVGRQLLEPCERVVVDRDELASGAEEQQAGAAVRTAVGTRGLASVVAHGRGERRRQAGDQLDVRGVEGRPAARAEEPDRRPRRAVDAQDGPQLVVEAVRAHEVAVSGAASRMVVGGKPQPTGRRIGARQVAVEVHVRHQELELPDAHAVLAAVARVREVLRPRRRGRQAGGGVEGQPHGRVVGHEAAQAPRGLAEERADARGPAGMADELVACVGDGGSQRCHDPPRWHAWR